jgi:cytochrome P450
MPIVSSGLTAMSALAEQIVDRLVVKESFCVVTELATALPIDIVASAVGLPQEGREQCWLGPSRCTIVSGR